MKKSGWLVVDIEKMRAHISVSKEKVEKHGKPVPLSPESMARADEALPALGYTVVNHDKKRKES